MSRCESYVRGEGLARQRAKQAFVRSAHPEEAPVNTRTIAVIALIIAVIVLVILLS
jgi:hypothetical protein